MADPLVMAIGRMKPGSRPPSEEGEGDPYETGLTETAEAVLSAVKAGDAGALSSALRSFFEQCDAMPHEEGEHE